MAQIGSKKSLSRVSRSTTGGLVSVPGCKSERRLLRLEALERRALLTGTITWAGAGNPLVIAAGAGQNDALTLELNAAKTDILISDANANTYTTAIAGASGSGTSSLGIPLASVSGGLRSTSTPWMAPTRWT